MDDLENLKKQHISNYRNVVNETIKNNSNVLVYDDIMPLFKKPPLDSMDFIKSKCLYLAKKYNLVLNTTELSLMIDEYRNSLVKICNDIYDIRTGYLLEKVASIPVSEDEIVKLLKKDFLEVNKKIKTTVKQFLTEVIQKKIVNNVNKIFTNGVLEEACQKFIYELKKYLTSTYQNKLLEDIDFKVLVKDTILISAIKEQGERFQFTLINSKIFE